MQRPDDEKAKLHVKGQIEAEIGAKPRAVFLRRVLSDHERHRVAGEIEKAERDERDDRHDGDRLEDAADDEGKHGWRLRPRAGDGRLARDARRCGLKPCAQHSEPRASDW